MASSSKWKLLMLLFWKTWIIQKSQKYNLITMSLVPLVIVFVLHLLRLELPTQRIPVQKYPPVSINNLDIFHKTIQNRSEDILHRKRPSEILIYSPKNMIYDKIIADATKRLWFSSYRSFPDAQTLRRELKFGQYIAGIEFPDDSAHITAAPHKFTFALRFPNELRTSNQKSVLTWNTRNLFREKNYIGPHNPKSVDGGLPPGYIREGFIPIQNAITRSYLKRVSGAEVPDVEMQRYSYKEYINDAFIIRSRRVLPFFLLLIYLYPSICIVKLITRERENRMMEILNIMGLSNWMNWMSWFAFSFGFLCLLAFLISIMFTCSLYMPDPIFVHTSFSVILCFLILYAIMLTCMCLMISAFFRNSSSAAAITGILCLVTNLPFLIPDFEYSKTGLAKKLFSCLLLNTALDFGFKLMLDMEQLGMGLQWSNILDTSPVLDDVLLPYVCGVMLIASVLFLLVGLYVMEIYPRKYGISRKWSFPLEYFECLMHKAKDESRESTLSQVERSHSEIMSIEVPDQTKNQVGMTIRDFQKRFKNRKTIIGVTWNMYLNEITVLLGCNGSGKTETMLMLAGAKQQTRATIDSRLTKITTEFKVTDSLGICTQENILFDHMSVRNHIVFFSRIRGLTDKDELAAEAQYYMDDVKLTSHANVAAWKLTTGMKRKLCLCCALCGNPKFVFCDEPTEGVDPISKNDLWDLLQSEKFGRTILIATSHVREADILGDRVGILSDGALTCYGTPYYLKRVFGGGFIIILNMLEGCSAATVTEFLRQYIPKIAPEPFMKARMVFRIPSENTEEALQMLTALELNSEILKVNVHKVTTNGLSGAYMHITSKYQPKKAKRNVLEGRKIVFHRRRFEKRKLRKFLNKIWGILLKKMLITYRHCGLYTCQIIFPVIFIIVFSILELQLLHTENPQRLPISLDSYSHVHVILETNNDLTINSLDARVAHEYKQYVTAYAATDNFERIHQPFENYSVELTTKYGVLLDYSVVAAATLKPNRYVAWLNNELMHAAPLSLNILYNAMARALISPDTEIRVINAPLPTNPKTVELEVQNLKQTGGLKLASFYCISFMSAFFGMLVIQERVSHAKLVQFVNGARFWTYWLGNFIWDYFTFALAVACLILTTFIFELFTKSELDLVNQLPLMLLYGILFLPRTYTLSQVFRDPATGFSGILVCNFFSGITVFMIIIAYKAIMKEEMKLIWLFRIFGDFGVFVPNNDETKQSHDFSNQFAIDSTNEVTMRRVVIVFMHCVVFIALLLILEGGCPPCVRSLSKLFLATLKSRRRRKGGNSNENDVFAEAEAIRQMSREDRANKSLVVQELSKNYEQFLAVDDISFHVDSGTAFSLLGPNGAGKTTTMKLIVGDLRIKQGNVYVQGLSMRNHKNKIRLNIGYCPQNNGLLRELTGRETLKIHSLLCGVEKSYIEQLTENMANAFSFEHVLNDKICNYTTECKRKLSVALAVLGSPKLVYLDEPSKGLDHPNRIQMWHMLAFLRDEGTSFLVTTASIKECLAFATHVSIMVNGKLKCIGTPDQLTERFTKGFLLQIMLLRNNQSINTSSQDRRSASSESLPHVYNIDDDQSLAVYETSSNEATERMQPLNVKDFVRFHFAAARLELEHCNVLYYNIPLSANLKCSDIFALFRRNRHQILIEDISISCMTMSKIFNNLVKLGRLERPSHVMIKRCNWLPCA